jgi:cytochrome P450
MQKPTTYTGIREHALQAFYAFKAASESEKGREDTILAKLWKHHESKKSGGLSDLDIASECADHLLAGIDTTADSLMFLIWALSRPQNGHIQRKLREEVRSIPDIAIVNGVPSAEICDKLPYLDAVTKETLRLYAPLPASEPRSSPRDTVIDKHHIPIGTVVSMSPFNLHRNPEVYRDPLEWKPERWLKSSEKELMEMKKWFWAFSSGGRMCIGLQYALSPLFTT